MTQKVFIISDTHFGHAKTFEVFKKENGEPLRPFKSLEEMHGVFIKNWNSVVQNEDLVLHLGDVAFDGTSYDWIMPQLNGTKYLIRGNHDRFSEGRYQAHFNRILGCYVRDNYAFTHVPIHPESGSRWIRNVHGHVHSNTLKDTNYINCSVENINYTPVDFDEIKKFVEDKPYGVFMK